MQLKILKVPHRQDIHYNEVYDEILPLSPFYSAWNSLATGYSKKLTLKQFAEQNT